MPDFSQPGAFDAYKRELQRKSLDTLMVANPTDQEYKVIWDKRIFPVPPKHVDMGYGRGKMQLPRYIAEKYAKEMKDFLINQMNKEKSEKMLADHYAKGREELSKHDENLKIHDKGIRTDNETQIAQMYDKLILGVVQEYSADYLDEAVSMEDMRPVEERITERMNRKYEPEVTEDMKTSKNNLLKDISQ